MKKALVSGVALLSVIGLAAGASAQETTPPTPVRQLGRFQEMSAPTHLDLKNLPSHANPNAVVSATVVLNTDSVIAASRIAAARGQRFDRAAAMRRVQKAQAVAIPRLRAAGATVQAHTGTVLDSVIVRVKVKDLRKLSKVVGVSSVHVSRVIQRDNGVSDVYTGVTKAWNDLGLTGKGMTIGVIDTGLDYYHADFGGTNGAAKYAADDPTVIEPGTFPTAKVVGGYDFVGDAYNADPASASYDPVPHPDPDPVDCNEHGTHVSGTAAGQGVLSDGTTFTGPYNASTIASHTWNVAPGAAPEASIRIYKVFGCSGSVNDDVLLAAIDRAVSDHVSVINMSLGSTWGTADEPLAVAIDNATKAGVLSVVSAGNDGPNAYLVGGPGTANTALSVAAVDTWSVTLPGVAISGAGALTSGQNSNEFTFPGGPISGTTVDVGLGCSDADFAPAAGKIAIATRGVCTRVERAVHATNAGALGVIFINNAAGYPPLEGPIPGASVPFVGVPDSAAGSLSNGLTVTLAASAPIPNPAYTNFAGFSSNGPRQDSAPKPDISAPGVNIQSAFVGSGDKATTLSGTSMASPHTAGIALLVRQSHPTWGPIAVKGALMSTANPSGVGDFNVRRGGAGMVAARDAVDTVSYFSTPDGRDSLAFGFRQLTGDWSTTKTITLTNTSRSNITYDMQAKVNTLGLTGLSVSLNPSVARVEAGHSITIEVTVRIKDPQHLPDATADDAGALAAISGLVFATPRSSGKGIHTLKTPLVLVPYGVSDIRATAQHGASSLTNSIRINNDGVHYGTYDTYQWIATDPAGDNGNPKVPDLRDLGVQQFNIQPGLDLMVVAINLHNRVTTHPTNEYDLLLDTNNDGTPDYYAITIDNGLFTTGAPDGSLRTFLFDAGFNLLRTITASAPANGSTVEVPIVLQDLGTVVGPIGIEADGYTLLDNLAPDSAFGLYDPTSPAVSTGAFDVVNPGGSTVLPVSANASAAAAQHALGWLVVSIDDAAGSREANEVPLRTSGR
jgi:subtilisin family serine protease